MVWLAGLVLACGDSDGATVDSAGGAGQGGASGAAGAPSGAGSNAGGSPAAGGGGAGASGRGANSGAGAAGAGGGTSAAGRGGAGRAGAAGRAGGGGAGGRAAGAGAAGGAGGAGDAGGAGGAGGAGEAGGGGAGAGGRSAAGAGAAGAGAGGAGGGSAAFDTACAPRITVTNEDPTGAGAGFASSVPNPEPFITDLTKTICRILYRNADEPSLPSAINLRVYDFDGVANAGGMQINLSTRHLANYRGAALTEEITGVLVHEATHLYQYNDGPGGLIEGIADYVRIEAGHHSPDRRRPGGNWDDGYTTTGFFLSWLDDQYPDFGYELNLTLTREDNEGWSEDAFEELTGKTVDTLWQEYQATF